MHLPALLAKKISATTPIFGTFSVEPLIICFVQLKSLAPSARYSTFKYPVTIKPGLGFTQGHRKLYIIMRHPRLPINVP